MCLPTTTGELNPTFPAFFVNSTAHYQHSYWRQMEPEKFTVQPTEREKDRYSDSILFGYQKMDELLGGFFRLEAEGANLVLATGHSQQPFLKWEAVGGQHFYRPHDVAAFLSELGIPYSAVEPVMTHQFKIRCETTEAARAAADTLQALTVDGQTLFNLHYHGDKLRALRCQVCARRCRLKLSVILKGLEPDVAVRTNVLSLDATKSGCHHPDGALWFKFGEARKHLATRLDPRHLSHVLGLFRRRCAAGTGPVRVAAYLKRLQIVHQSLRWTGPLRTSSM